MRSFRIKLFVVYSLTLITLTLSFSIPMYFYFKNNIQQNIVTSVEQLSGSTASNLSSQLNMFNNMTFQLYNSYDNTRSTLANYLLLERDVDDTDVTLKVRKSIDNFMMIANNTYKSIDELHLYTASGELFSKKGNESITRVSQINNNAYLADAADGAAIVTSQGSPSDFAISRKLQWGLFDIGYLEAMLKPNTLIDFDKLSVIKGANLFVIHQGQVIYASAGTTDEANETLSGLDRLTSSETAQLTIQEDGLLAVKQLTEDPAFMVLTIVPEKQLFKPLRVFRVVLFLSIILLIIFSVAFYYWLAKILTRPITSLKHVMDGIKIDDEHELQIENKYKMDEIESLRRSFQKMNDRLKKSMDDKVHFQTLQLQSHFQTLQSQINPHFLFNMLSVITIMADKKDSAAVAEVSRKLSQFMRYSISTDSSMAQLEQEIMFTDNYLNLMKSRYMHRLHYTIDIPDELLELSFPKLTIQPIVENCIHHGLHEDMQQLRISVKGIVTFDRWEIIISDNGRGFSEGTLFQLNQRIEEYMIHLQSDYTKSPQSLTLGGMGLISTLARLNLVGKVSYSIENHADGGAQVSLQGVISATQEAIR
ncbi:MAG: sensor histidine kinase [Candidatus Pristimantibacillus sp.]